MRGNYVNSMDAMITGMSFLFKEILCYIAAAFPTISEITLVDCFDMAVRITEVPGFGRVIIEDPLY